MHPSDHRNSASAHTIISHAATMIRRVAGLAVLLLGMCAGEAAAAGGKTISKVPYVISKPGLYVLAKDLTTPLTSGTAIIIATNHVTIDLNGHGISCVPATGATPTLATGIYAYGVGHLTVRNGSLSGFHAGMFVNTVFQPGLLVEDMLVNSSKAVGMVLGCFAPVIRRCSVLNTTNSADVIGIFASGSAAYVGYCTVHNTTSSSASSRGIEVFGGQSTVEHNRVTNPTLTAGSFGIQAFFGMFVNDNHVANMATGIDATIGTSKLSRNLTTGCTTAFNGGTLVDGND